VEGATTSYTYDNADRMTAAGGVGYTYDNNGNQTGRGSDVFGWDVEDRLISATVNGTAVTYAYRGDDLRHSKTQGGVTTVYTWDLAASLPVVLQDGTTTYVYGLGLISQTTGTTTSYPLSDGLGSTAALTDSSGAVTATYKYDVFGAVRASTGPGSTDFRFAGQQDDPALGYQYLRARYYDPATGRFISKDPFGGFAEDPRTQQPYSYAIGNPVNYRDPTGEAVPVVIAAAYLLLAAASMAGIATIGMEENRLALERSIQDLCGRAADGIRGMFSKKIPDKARDVLDHVDKYGAAPKGYKGGREYTNKDGKLPTKDAQGKDIKYREWDVNPHTKGVNRGNERLVTGSDGSARYTNDHYGSFEKFR